MGPSLLFDKSALQRLNLDESVWFDHFFTTIVSPLLFVETLGDLSKDAGGRAPEGEVQSIARRTPQMNSSAHVFHVTIATGELLGNPVRMDGRPMPPKTRLEQDKSGRVGLSVVPSEESEALRRWMTGEFEDIERASAARWRTLLPQLDFEVRIQQLRDIGVLGPRCKSLAEAHALATSVISGRTWPFDMLELVFSFFHVPAEYHAEIRRRFEFLGRPRLVDFAPYVAHLMSIDVFFYAGVDASLIGRDRKSSKIDIEYLYYLPFCEVFTSADGLHARCVPYFLRPDQRFVLADDLKADLKQIDLFFKIYPEAERERGLYHFAPVPPRHIPSLVAELWDKYRPNWRAPQETSPNQLPDVDTSIPGVSETRPLKTIVPKGFESQIGWLKVERWVLKRKGSWWQLPKDLPMDDTRQRAAAR